jgi:predicted nucleotide-binding protein
MLTVGMNDEEFRELILRRMYDQRRTKRDFVASDFSDLVPEVAEFGRVCFQLRDKGFIDWISPVGDQFIGMSHARITTSGIEFIEQKEADELDNIGKISNSIQMSQSGDRDAKIARLLKEGRQLLEEHDPTSAHMAFEGWVSSVGRWLASVNTALSAQWLGLPNSRLVVANAYYNDAGSWLHFRETISGRLTWLGKALATIAAPKEQKRQPEVKTEFSNEIFIVHGHGGELKEAAARLVKTLGLQPIILHEQANKGRTIIEKFSDHAQAAGFAIVLLSADDIGGPKGTLPDALQPRARQNVVLELGYFFGALGRDRVCAIHEQGVEIPSDLQGLVYIQYDIGGSWKYQVAKEIKGAGYEVDLNKL